MTMYQLEARGLSAADIEMSRENCLKCAGLTHVSDFHTCTLTKIAQRRNALDTDSYMQLQDGSGSLELTLLHLAAVKVVVKAESMRSTVTIESSASKENNSHCSNGIIVCCVYLIDLYIDTLKHLAGEQSCDD